MPIGHTDIFGKEAYIPVSTVLERVPELKPVSDDGGVARLYALPNAKGTVGLISPLSNHFCDRCNRIRLTSDGKIKPCLHSPEEIPLRGLHGEELRTALESAIVGKHQRHDELSPESRSKSMRDMNSIGG